MKRLILVLLIVIAVAFPARLSAYAQTAFPPTNISYNTSTGKITGVNTQMEYSTDGEKTWIRVSSNDSFTPSPGTTYYFRYKAIGTIEASTSVKIDVPGSDPNAKTLLENVKYENGKISGVKTTMEYNKVSATAATWTKCTSSDQNNGITITLTQSSQTYYFRIAATSAVSASAPITITVPAASKSDASEIKLNFAIEKFEGFGEKGEGWYYTTFGSTYVGQYLYEIKDTTLKADPGLTYYFRKLGDIASTAFQSPARTAAPTGITYDALNSKILGVDDTMQYVLNGTPASTATPVLQGNTFINIVQTESVQSILIAYKATDKAYRSNYYTLNIWPKSKVDAKFNALRYVNGKVEGTSDEMEYQAIRKTENYDPSGVWIKCTDTPPVITRTSEDLIVYFRLINDPTKVESIEIPLLLPAPDVTLNMKEAKITGLNPNLTYIYSAGSGWKAAAALLDSSKTEFNIESLLKPASTIDIMIAQKPVAGNPEPDSITTITIDKAPVKPVVTLLDFECSGEEMGYAKVKITGGTKIQYKLLNSPTWGTILENDGDILLPVGFTTAAYIFRFPITEATDTKNAVQASPEVKLSISAPAKPPNLKADYKKEQLTIKGGMSYSTDGVTWIDVPKSSSVVLKLNECYGTVIKIRVTATNKKPASFVQTLSILPRFAYVPTSDDVFITEIKGKLTVVMRSGARQVEYKDTNGKWKKGVPKYSDNLNTEIRFMADTMFAPSESVTLTKDGI